MLNVSRPWLTKHAIHKRAINCYNKQTVYDLGLILMAPYYGLCMTSMLPMNYMPLLRFSCHHTIASFGHFPQHYITADKTFPKQDLIRSQI